MRPYPSSVFPCQAYACQPSLPSFPTRRSSDLIRGGVPRGRRLPGAGQHRLRPGPRQGDRDRSEEHTSELQSRGQLVCRLLLEKKKTRKKDKFTSRGVIRVCSVVRAASKEKQSY